MPQRPKTKRQHLKGWYGLPFENEFSKGKLYQVPYIAKYTSNDKINRVLKGRDIISKNQDELERLRNKVNDLKLRGFDSNYILRHEDFKNFRRVSEKVSNALEQYRLEDTKNILAPYDELFADVIAVIGTDDPRAIYRATSTANRGEVGRDFTRNYPLASWSESSPHLLFAPFRSYLWKRYLSKSEFKNKKGMIIESLMRAISKEVDFYAESRLIDLPSEKNIRLIDAFEDELNFVL